LERRFLPRELALGVDERGLEKGCATPVEVAAAGEVVMGVVEIDLAKWD